MCLVEGTAADNLRAETNSERNRSVLAAKSGNRSSLIPALLLKKSSRPPLLPLVAPIPTGRILSQPVGPYPNQKAG